MAQSPDKSAPPYQTNTPTNNYPPAISPRPNIAPSPMSAGGSFTFPSTPHIAPSPSHMGPPFAGHVTPMGPPTAVPQKPVEKKEESTDFSDILVSTGIDLKDEETALTSEFFSSQARPPPFVSQNAASFASSSSFGPSQGAGSFNTPNSSFGILNGAPNGYGSQDYKSSQSADDLTRQQERLAARRLAESQANHLNSPFLNPNILRQKINSNLQQKNIRANQGDNLTNGQPRYNNSTATTPGGYGVTAVYGQNYFSESNLSDILALISLAAADHLRSLTESAIAFSVGRRTTSHGEIPADFLDMAIKNEDAPLVNGNAADLLPMDVDPPVVNGRKRSLSAMQNGSAPRKPVVSSSPVAYNEEIAKALYAKAKAEFDAEEARLARRAARQAASTSTQAQSTSNPGTPTACSVIGEKAPEVDPKKRLTKEQRKQSESKANEASMHRSTNTTASMMLGGLGLGKKKKQYSWMTPGGSGAATPGTPTGGAAAPSTSGNGGSGLSDMPSGGAIPGSFPATKIRKLGDWREDGDQGFGIQLRDLIAAFEADGREKLSLNRAYAKLR